MENSLKVIGAKFPRRQANLIAKVCKLRGESLSGFLRRAVKKELASLNYLDDEEKRALGVEK